MGEEAVGRQVTAASRRHNLVVNLVEYPAVARGRSRLRLQVMADHSPTQLEHAANALRRATEEVTAGQSTTGPS